MENIKTKKEIEYMREGGRIAARVLDRLKSEAKPGKTTLELDTLAEKIILEAGAKPSFKGFKGYPKATCISVNDEVVHGIPCDRQLNDGDIAGIDVGVFYKGFHTDTAITVSVGKISDEAQKLINVTQESLNLAISLAKPGVHLGDIQSAIQQKIEGAGLAVIRDLAGHGVGRELQEAPSIPNYGEKGKGLVLKEGMTLAIEPMVAMGDWPVRVLDDGWTVVTSDGSLSAHFEHTIVVTNQGSEILTK